ncbi:MAG: DNA mismatch repair protein MutS [Nitrospirae bacterium]|nr:MAG: DNA mismatch repair protein MutS [Nitrospirota bacterium]
MRDDELTPLMRQYRDIKHAYQEAIVFFRVGDFYEMFFEDAEEASAILNIALTSRDKQSPQPIPLCGVPHHAAQVYIAKLLQAGRTVALCEQMEDPQQAKGLVRREVVRVYTPGTLFDEELLDAKASNFLAALCVANPSHADTSHLGLAALDISTGEFFVSEYRGPHAWEHAMDELFKLAPQELLIPKDQDSVAQTVSSLPAGLKLARVVPQEPAWFSTESAQQVLSEHFQGRSLISPQLDDLPVSLQAAGAILHYIRQTQPTLDHRHIQTPVIRRHEQEMHLDGMTIRNLELLAPLSEGPKPDATLLAILDRTHTAMGGRLLRQWIVRPLIHRHPIELRLQAVSALVNNLEVRSSLQAICKRISDIERVGSRIAIGSATPRDLLNLRESLALLPSLATLLRSVSTPLFDHLLASWDDLADVRTVIETAISPDAPASVRDGGIIRDGYHPELDALRHIAREGMQWLTDLEARERARTGIESLKVKFNQVFGYYIEVTKPNLSRVPPYFIRKQTLANAERFTTEELKQLEDRITTAHTKVRWLEQDLFAHVLTNLRPQTPRLQAMAKCVAVVDVLASLADVAVSYQYVCPEIHEGGTIEIVAGRHPVVERTLLPERFIPNDTYLNFDDHRLLLLTGPNMAGKSTYLRQVGLIVLLAQIGSFVPADRARIGLVDRIFTRVGASDNLSAGQSTFMVEMLETARILHSATPRSLILLDEIGRGTSTYDGLSIAWSVAEFLHDRTKLGARTLFATHYHEMTALEELLEGIKNYTVLVKEDKGTILFLRKICRGKVNKSYGIHVATLAGLPSEVIIRAQEVLHQLEQGESSDRHSVHKDLFGSSHQQKPEHLNPVPHQILQDVKQMDLFSMTPLEAMNRLAELQRRLEED